MITYFIYFVGAMFNFIFQQRLSNKSIEIFTKHEWIKIEMKAPIRTLHWTIGKRLQFILNKYKDFI